MGSGASRFHGLPEGALRDELVRYYEGKFTAAQLAAENASQSAEQASVPQTDDSDDATTEDAEALRAGADPRAEFALRGGDDLSHRGRYRKDGMQRICATVRSKHASQRLLCLELPDCAIGPPEVGGLCDLLKANGTLTKLNLRGNRLGPNGTRLVAELLMVNGGITRKDDGSILSLLESEAARANAVPIVKHGALLEVDLSDNAVGTGVDALVESLKFNSRLHKLALASNGIDLHGMSALSDALNPFSNTTLTSIDLAHNVETPVGAGVELDADNSRPTRPQAREGEQLAMLWASVLSETATDAKQRAIKREGENLGGGQTLTSMMHHLDGQRRGCHLLHLDIRGVDVSVAGGTALAQMLRDNTSMAMLALGTPGAPIEVERLRNADPELRALDFSSKGLGVAGAIVLASLLHDGSAPALTDVDLRSCNIGAVGARALIAALRVVSLNGASPLKSCCGIPCRKLLMGGRQHLDLSLEAAQKKLEVGGALMLAYYMTIFSGSLASLRLDGNIIGDEGKAAIGLALQLRCFTDEISRRVSETEGEDTTDDSGPKKRRKRPTASLRFTCDEWCIEETTNTLDLCDHDLGMADTHLLAGVLPFASSLTELNLSDNLLGRSGVHKLCNALGTEPDTAPGCCKIRILQLARCGLDHVGLLEDVVPLLSRCGLLEILVLSGNKLLPEAVPDMGNDAESAYRPDAMDAFAEEVVQHPALAVLQCEEVPLHLLSLLGDSPMDLVKNLRLDLRGQLCTADAVILGRILRDNTTLELLHYKGFISARGKLAIGKALLANRKTRLRYVTNDDWSIGVDTKLADCSKIGMTLADAVYLTGVLKSNKKVTHANVNNKEFYLSQLRGVVDEHLRELSFASSGIHPEDMVLLGHCVQFHPRLLHLDLSNNFVGSGVRPESLEALAVAVRELRLLQTLKLANNFIGERPGTYGGIVALCTSLCGALELTHLDLSSNMLPGPHHDNDAGLYALAEAIEHGMPQLSHLDLSANRLWHQHRDSAVALAQAIEARTEADDVSAAASTDLAAVVPDQESSPEARDPAVPQESHEPQEQHEHSDLDESLDIMSSGLGLTATLTQEKITTLIVHDNCIGKRAEWRSAGERIDVRPRAPYSPGLDETNTGTVVKGESAADLADELEGMLGTDAWHGSGGASSRRSHDEEALHALANLVRLPKDENIGFGGSLVQCRDLQPAEMVQLPFVFYFR